MKKRLFKILRNKYFIVTAIFFFFFIFIDDNGLLTSVKLQQQLNRLKETEAHCISEIERDSIETVRLRNDINHIEKYGREVYYMKRSNEDVFLISRPK